MAPSALSFFLVALQGVAAIASTYQPRLIMYYTGQHQVIPEPMLVEDLTHVCLAFMAADVFNREAPGEWPMWTTVEAVRPKFPDYTKIIMSVGGWAASDHFADGARNETTRKRFAKNVAAMIEDTGADGIDIDWEYPGGNGDDYKRVPNSEREWEIDAYPLLLEEIRAALPRDKLMTAAIPGLVRDKLGFPPKNFPRIIHLLDFVNVMTYDMMNRRDNFTTHHAGVALSVHTINDYIARGAPADKINLGFAFYVKWFKTLDCRQYGGPLSCPTEIMEDPETGADTGKSGSFSWHDPVPEEVADSFERAMVYGVYDNNAGGHYYWDEQDFIFWSFETPASIHEKVTLVVGNMELGGVFAWGLGEDAPKWDHYKELRMSFNTEFSGFPGPWESSGRDEL